MKDKAKKLLVGVVILEIIILIFLICLIIKKGQKKISEEYDFELEHITEEKYEILSEEQEEVITNEEEEIKTEEKISEDKATVEKEIENKTTNNDKNNKVKKNDNISKNNSDNTDNKKENNNATQSQIPVNNIADDNKKEENKKNENTGIPLINQNTPVVEEPKKEEEDKKIEPPKKNIITYEYNDNMTKKMISIIESNESDYMKEYGYSIEIDKNIIELTNQFTYSDQRVIDKLTYKFGKIRVYARDYYVDGEYKWTECYII